MNMLRLKKNKKYLFDYKDCIEYFADSCSIKGCSEKNDILNFINIWQKIWSQMIIVKFGQHCIIEREQIISWAWNQFLLLRISKTFFPMVRPILHCLVARFCLWSISHIILYLFLAFRLSGRLVQKSLSLRNWKRSCTNCVYVGGITPIIGGYPHNFL